MNKQSEKRTLFNWFIEIIFWIKTFLSPVFGGLIIGSIFYFYIDSNLGVYLFWIFCTIGIIGGVYLANRVWKTQGTSNFQSKIMATPDLDNFKILDPSSKKMTNKTMNEKLKALNFIEIFIAIILSIIAVYNLDPTSTISFIIFALWLSSPFLIALFLNITKENKIGLTIGVDLSILIGVIFYFDIKYWHPDPQGGLVFLFLPVLFGIIIILAFSFIKFRRT